MPQPPASAHSASQTIAKRIEELYGQPLAELEALADNNPHGNILAALTNSHTELAFAERNIAFQKERLRELTSPEREIGRFEAGHILDCARRIADSVAARDAYAKSLGAVLGGLRRVPGPETQPAAPPVPAAPAPATSRTR